MRRLPLPREEWEEPEEPEDPDGDPLRVLLRGPWGNADLSGADPVLGVAVDGVVPAELGGDATLPRFIMV